MMSLRIFSHSTSVCRRALLLFGASLSLVAAGCGGGGGGGGSSSDDSSSDGSGVRVLHASVDGYPVDVISSVKSEPVSKGTYFARSVGYKRLPSGDQSISVTRTLSPSSIVRSFSVSVDPDATYSLIVYGEVLEGGPRVRLLTDAPPDAPDRSYVRVVNGVSGAAEIGVVVGGSDVSGTSVSLGDGTGYVPVAPGVVRVSATAGESVIATASLTAQPGGAYTVLVAGEAGYYVTSRVYTDR
jgi:hypothetical protein